MPAPQFTLRAKGGWGNEDSLQINGWHRRTFLQVAAGLALLIVAGLVTWTTICTESDPRGAAVAALEAAYRDHRPMESRISSFAHSRWIPEGDPSGTTEAASRLEPVERILLDHDTRTPEFHHAYGIYFLSQGNLDRAIREFESAAANRPDKAQYHNDLGAALLEKAKADKSRSARLLGRAFEEMQAALELDGFLDAALFNLALCHQEMGDQRKAEKAWRAYLERDPDSAWAREAKGHLDRIRATRSLLEKEYLLNEFRTACKDRGEARAWEIVARTRSRNGDHIVDSLIDEYITQLASGRNGRAGLVLTELSYVGNLHVNRTGDRFTLDLAEFYRKLTPVSRLLVARARSLNEAAAIKFSECDFEEAIRLYARAGDLFNQAGDTCEALLADLRRGVCYLRIPDNKRSKPVFEALRDVAVRKRYRSLLAHALIGLADLETSAVERSKALMLFDEARAVASEIGDNEAVVRSIQGTAAMYQQLRKHEESLTYCLTAFRLARELPDDPRILWTTYHLAAAELYSLGFSRAALDLRREALEVALESRWPLIISRSHGGLAWLNTRLGNYDAAIESAHAALDEAGRIKGEKARLNATGNSLLRLAEPLRLSGRPADALDRCDDAIRIYSRLGFDVYSLEAHGGRMQALIDLNDLTRAKEEMAVTLDLLEQDRRRIREDINRISFFNASQEFYDRAIEFTFERLKNPTLALEISDQSHARSLLQLMSERAEAVKRKPDPSSPFSLREIQQRVPKDTQILQYAVLPEKLLVWLIDRTDEVKSEAVPIREKELADKVKRFHELRSRMAAGDGDIAEQEARELYDILIRPVATSLKKDGYVFIVPDKALNHVSFGSLMSPSGRYLIEDHVIGMTPSATIFVRCADRARERPEGLSEKILVVGDPRFDRQAFPNLDNLESAAKEARDVREIYAEQNPVLLIDKQAEEGRVRREMEIANVVHVAGHYVPNEESPFRSGLLLTKGSQPADSDDGILQASEVYRMKLPQTWLAVLSACQTGAEQSYSGEGAIGIARPFIKAGVPVVVASLWFVESHATAELMVRFHRYRKKGEPTARALLLAQREMLRSESRLHKDPFAWGAFVVIGGYSEY